MNAGPETETRRYTQTVRAEKARHTRKAILEAANRAFSDRPYDMVALRAIAEDAEVSLQTVMRLFESKEKLLATAATEAIERLFDARTPVTRIEDVELRIREAIKPYDSFARLTVILFTMAERFEQLQPIAAHGKQQQYAWIEHVFRFHLPADPLRRKQCLTLLFTALSVYTWHSLRTEIGLSVEAAREAMIETAMTLANSWQKNF